MTDEHVAGPLCFRISGGGVSISCSCGYEAKAMSVEEARAVFRRHSLFRRSLSASIDKCALCSAMCRRDDMVPAAEVLTGRKRGWLCAPCARRRSEMVYR